MVALKLACIEKRLTWTNISTFESHHPLEYKFSVIRTLFHWADTVVTDPEDHQSEKEHVKTALRRCGYVNFVVAPYVQGVSEKLRWVFSSYGVSICFKPYQTLICKILVAPKDRTKVEDQTGVVHRIPCGVYIKVYVGKPRDHSKSVLKNTLQKLPTISLQWQNITKRQDTSQIWTTSRSYAGRINCCLVKYVRLYS